MENIIELEVVEKYNPYHDKLGRFTSAGNATSFTFRSASGLAWDEKNVQRAIEREKQRTSGGGSKVDGCNSVKEVEGLFKEKDWFTHVNIRGTDYRSDDNLKLDGCDLESAKETYRAYEDFYNKYPQMVGKLRPPTTIKTRGSYWAQATVDSGNAGNRIDLNEKSFGNSKAFKKEIESCERSGYHPKGCDTIKSVVMHELGHNLDGYLTTAEGALGTKYNPRTSTKSSYMSHALRKNVAKECGVKKLADMKDEVSGYATKDNWEWFAESFAEFMCSPNPRKVATEMGKQLDEVMKGVK